MAYKRFEDAADAVLTENRSPMPCDEIIDEVFASHLWSRRAGANPKTKYNSLYGTLIKAVQKKGTKLGRKGNTDIFFAHGLDRTSGKSTPAKRRAKKGITSHLRSITPTPELFIEGDIHEITLELKKRDQKLKKYAIARYGLTCQICGFNFQEVYGSLGSGYIELHHLIPLSKHEGPIDTNVNDVTVVCANCHRVLHRTVGKPVQIEVLRRAIKTQKKSLSDT